ncbi:MAG TPA: hypothetical protein VGX68_19245 [Thermoanaerobaculia bacterium]|jgi:hypothetical protein|nr:hypothetical protein [Thermoanaerobaculia bacterium]
MDDSARHEESFVRTFEAEPGGILVVRVDRGSISVHGTEADRVEVTATLRLEADDPEQLRELRERCKLDFDQSGRHVRVKARTGRRRLFDWPGSHDTRIELSFRIAVPRRFDLDLKTLAGGIRVDGIEGEVRTRTAAGSVAIGDVAGSVQARTYAGSIQTGRIDGRVVASSWAGAIRVREVTGGIEANSKSGSVAAFLSGLPRGENRLSCLSGNVEVRLAEGIGLDLDADARSGRVVLDFPMDGTGGTRRRTVQQSINGGGPRLVLRATAGNIHVKR